MTKPAGDDAALRAAAAALLEARAAIDAAAAAIERALATADTGPADMIGVQEIAACLGVSEDTVYRLMNDGFLPSQRLRRRRVARRGDVEALARGDLVHMHAHPAPLPPPATRPQRSTRRVIRPV